MRKFLLLILKGPITKPLIFHRESSQEAKESHWWELSEVRRMTCCSRARAEADSHKGGQHFLFLKPQPSPRVNAWAWSCALQSHLDDLLVPGQTVLVTKETPMVTGITPPPKQLEVISQSETHRTGRRCQKWDQVQTFSSGYNLKIHIPDGALSALTSSCVFSKRSLSKLRTGWPTWE